MITTTGQFDDNQPRHDDGKFATKVGAEAEGGTSALKNNDGFDGSQDARDVADARLRSAAHLDMDLGRKANITRSSVRRARVAATVRAMEHVAGHSADISTVEFRDSGPLVGLGASTALDGDGTVRFFEDRSLQDSMHELARDPSRWSEFAEWDGGDTVTLDVAKMRDYLDSPMGTRAIRKVDRFHPDHDRLVDR